MFTLLVPGLQKSNFSSGLETILGGALRPWEYSGPTPDASRAPKTCQELTFYFCSKITKNETFGTLKLRCECELYFAHKYVYIFLVYVCNQNAVGGDAKR